jgi:TetR/AcrR family transcriptional regulator, transcriptional repressor for nem operon
MARHREFDEEQALDKAMALFWQNGFNETAVRDLVEFTGVAHAGLYAAFGDKRQLFEMALDRYCQTVMGPILAKLAAPGAGKESIYGFFEDIMVLKDTTAFRNGCLFCNSIIEIGGEDEMVARKVKEFAGTARRAVINALGNAQNAGDIAKDADINALADYFITLFHGIAVRLRARASDAEISRSVKAGLMVLQ